MKAIYRYHAATWAFAIAVANCGHNDNQSARAKEPRVHASPATEERRVEEPRDAPFIGGGPAEPNSAVARIAAARCDREARCNNVGRKERYPSRSDCIVLMQDGERDDINEKDCPGGIDQKQLGACLSAIRDEACGNSLDTISRVVSCRSVGICLK